jgi:hypothetical protein
MEKIFIQIASYRDPQLSKTIASCINNAVNPERLTFGIVNQYAEQDTFNSDLDPYRSDSRFTFMDVIWYESNGACWARTRTQHMYKGETYTLQLDSHMRLAAGWDEYLIQCMQITGSEKPFLTAYVAAYEAEKEDENTVYEPTIGYMMVPNRMTHDASVHTIGTSFPLVDGELVSKPMPARFASGHFYFTLGKHCLEYQYDENMYFDGEEIHLAVVSYTLGYDLYHPDKNYLWHDYCSYERSKHWGDHAEVKDHVTLPWWRRDQIAKQRLKKLFGVEENLQDMGKHRLGSVRTLEEYEAYAGIDFKTKKMHTNTLTNTFPPTVELGDKSWLINLQQYWYNFASWVNELEPENPIRYYIGFDDEYSNAIYHEWLDKHTLEKDFKIGKYFSFYAEERPTVLVLWGVDEQGNWGTKKSINLFQTHTD